MRQQLLAAKQGQENKKNENIKKNAINIENVINCFQTLSNNKNDFKLTKKGDSQMMRVMI